MKESTITDLVREQEREKCAKFIDELTERVWSIDSAQQFKIDEELAIRFSSLMAAVLENAAQKIRENNIKLADN